MSEKDTEVIVENMDNEIDKELETEALETEAELSDEKVSAPVNKKLKKHDEAKILVEKAKTIVARAEEQMDACRMLLADDLKAYEAAKLSLKEGGMDESERLLSVLGYDAETSEDISDEGVVFETKDDPESIALKDVSSGRFTGFLFSLVGGAATLIGAVYYATNKLGMTLDITKVPSKETLHTIFGWFGTQLGRPDDAINGGLAVGAATLLVMLLIYAIRVGLKGSKNLHIATKQLEEAEAYTLKKGSCKEEMDKVDAHIQDAINTLKDYEVLFNEQKGKLQRILHFEGNSEDPEYHERSLNEMKETQSLLDAIKSFMAVALSEEGKLSGKSTLFLHRAKSRMQKILEGRY